MKAGDSGQDAFQGEPTNWYTTGLGGQLVLMGPKDDDLGEAWMALSQLVRWAAPAPRRITFIRAGEDPPKPERTTCKYCLLVQPLNGHKHLDGCLVGECDKLLGAIYKRWSLKNDIQAEVDGSHRDALHAAIFDALGLRLARERRIILYKIWRLRL